MAFLGIVGAFIPGLFGKQIGGGLAKVLGVAILIPAVLGLLFLAKFAYDRSVINNYESGVTAVVANKTLAADRAADVATANEINEFRNEQDRLEDAANEAARRDPVNSAKPLGPVSQSYYDNLPEDEPKKEKHR